MKLYIYPFSYACTLHMNLHVYPILICLCIAHEAYWNMETLNINIRTSFIRWCGIFQTNIKLCFLVQLCHWRLKLLHRSYPNCERSWLFLYLYYAPDTFFIELYFYDTKSVLLNYDLLIYFWFDKVLIMLG